MIDCDSHVLEPADLWLKYLEVKYVDQAIRIEEEDGVEKLIIGVVASVLLGVFSSYLSLANEAARKSNVTVGLMVASQDCPSSDVLG